MREKHTVQRSIFEHYAEHEIGLELKSMSGWLDQNMDLLDWVAADINPRTVEDTGRKGLSVESVLRCAILKQYRQLPYEDLVFCLMDSASCQTFARLNLEWFPQKVGIARLHQRHLRCHLGADQPAFIARRCASQSGEGRDAAHRQYRDSRTDP